MLQGLPKRLLDKYVILIAAYTTWILVIRLLCLSFLVYFLTRAGHRASFQEINEAFGNNEIPFIGLSSGLFLLLLKGLSPLIDSTSGSPSGSTTGPGPLSFSFRDFRTQYLPGFMQGAVLALSVVAGFLLTGCFRYVGFFVQIEDTGLAVLGIVFRIIALLALGFCEEYLFRYTEKTTLARMVFYSLLYCVVKLAQFDLSWMHFATLFLFSTALTARRAREASFLSGAGFLSAVLIVFHPLFSLPIFGSDFSGIFLLKYQPQVLVPAILSGGQGGPLSSVGLQAVLLIETLRGWITYKKSLLKVPATL